MILVWCFILPVIPGPLNLQHPQDPATDTLTEQQRDSLLFQLNLAYLNGVQDHRSPFELIPIIKKILAIDPAQYNHWFNLGMEQITIREYEKAIESFQKGLEIHPDPSQSSLIQVQLSLSFCYHKTQRHRREQEILDMVNEAHPDHPGVLGRYVVCAHSRMRYKEANHYRDRLVEILRSEGVSKSDVAYYLGRLYLNTDQVEAEKYFREAYRYDPEDVEKMGALAWVLITSALTLDEGLSLIEEAIRKDPDNAQLIHQQGYGFYLKGNYEDALFNLYNAQELYEEYNYDLNDHIRMVEDAIAGQSD